MECKWVCNKCGYETKNKPLHRNAICIMCGKGRYKYYAKCECGIWFHPDRTVQKYCSVECGIRYKEKGGKKGKHYPHTQRARIAVCAVCGKGFRAVHDTKNRISKYCSKECWSKRNPKASKRCPICGCKFSTYDKDAVYCSRACYNKYKKTLVGELSHFWKGGRTKESKLRRTSTDYKEWRLKVFTRDGFKCQSCGSVGRNLEAHHIKEVCDYPELIYDVNNGITLCHECHKKTDNYGYKARWKDKVIEK